jgi:predicted PurR-regulated permease PerM
MSDKDTRTSLVTFLIVLVAVVGVTLRMVAPYLMAITMGGILALLANPVYRRLVGRGLKPQLAAALVTVGVIVIVVGPLLGFAGVAIRQAITVGKWIANAPHLSVPEILDRVRAWLPIDAVVGDTAEMQAQLQEWLQGVGSATTAFLLQLAKSLPDVILQMLLACLACYFFFLDGRHFFSWLYNKIPLETDIRHKLTSSFRDTAISVVWASMAAAATQAVVMGLAFLILGVPAATLAAGATFIFAWIPILGSTPVWISGATYLFMQGFPAKAAVMVGFGAFTGVIDNFVRPWVLKGRGEMHPLVSLVAIFGGIQMFGIFGVFIGPILAAIVITLLQVWPIVGRRSGLHLQGSPVESVGPDGPGGD